MFDYIQKFASLPEDVKGRISNPEVSARIEALEEKYNVDLAKVVMQVATKDIPLDYIGLYFLEEFGMDGADADALTQDLYREIFGEIADHLALPAPSAVSSEQNQSLHQDEFAGANNPVEAEIFEESGQNLQVESRSSQADHFVAAASDPMRAGITIPIKVIKTIPSPMLAAGDDEIKEDLEEIAHPEAESHLLGVLPAAPVQTANPKITASPLRQVESRQDDSLIFAIADEAEVNSFQAKADSVGKQISDDRLNILLAEIVKESNITFSGQNSADRFNQIAKTYIRGVRKRIEAKIALLKPFSTGGLGFFEAEAEQALSRIDGSISKLQAELRISQAKRADRQRLEELMRKTERDIPYDLRNALKERTGSTMSSEAAPMAGSWYQIAAEAGNFTSAMAGLGKVAVKVGHAQPDSQSLINEQFSAPVSRRPVMTGSRKRMEDVPFAPKVMGPVDELRYMDLINFRRLNPDPVKAAAKIKEKIDLIGEEHYAKRIEGINSWRMSPANKLYLAIGNDSIMTGKPVSAVIENRKHRGEEYLSIKEFEAIMDLNKSLRF